MEVGGLSLPQPLPILSQLLMLMITKWNETSHLLITMWLPSSVEEYIIAVTILKVWYSMKVFTSWWKSFISKIFLLRLHNSMNHSFMVRLVHFPLTYGGEEIHLKILTLSTLQVGLVIFICCIDFLSTCGSPNWSLVTIEKWIYFCYLHFVIDSV